ncbi:hypothetical protein UVI_02040840 [Ustilaginoidea virens]|uniref:Uncharacterized protein n=1 Tax=Ustilaginoidea virens TaxID=1159556 RepID=A0A1B5L5L3_USTVR|nr:hypothetical protein UVI_02040840 [Ustilaginoidea virens]
MPDIRSGSGTYKYLRYIRGRPQAGPALCQRTEHWAAQGGLGRHDTPVRPIGEGEASRNRPMQASSLVGWPTDMQRAPDDRHDLVVPEGDGRRATGDMRMQMRTRLRTRLADQIEALGHPASFSFFSRFINFTMAAEELRHTSHTSHEMPLPNQDAEEACIRGFAPAKVYVWNLCRVIQSAMQWHVSIAWVVA